MRVLWRTLSLEDEYCPYCGQVNKHAKKHIKDMRRYQGEFEDTRKYVHDKTIKYTEIVVRVIILAVLIVLNITFFSIGFNVWEIKWNIKDSVAISRFKEYSQIMDGYLEDEDYVAFAAFCESNGIRAYQDRYWERYGYLINVCSGYTEAYSTLFDYAGFDKNDSISHLTELTGQQLDYFYKYYLNEGYIYTDFDSETEEYRRILDNMENNIELILVTYCGFTEEEAAAMPTMSKPKRDILLEEKLEEKLQNEQ